jgi:Zn-dependent protease
MAPLLLRQWRLVRIPAFGDFFLHATAPTAAFLALIVTGRAEWLLICLGFWFASVVHALGHLTAARFRGELPESFTLFPFWPVTKLMRPPARIVDDLLITAAGPLANGLLGASMLLTFDGPLGHSPEWFGTWSRIQIGLGAVSLLPIYPLDGSRLLRLALKLRYPEKKAWDIAGFIGQATAAGIIFWALIQGFYSVVMIGIAFYLIGRFSPIFLEIGKWMAEAKRVEEQGIEGGAEEYSGDGETITLTQTADGVWQQIEPSPSNEARRYF